MVAPHKEPTGSCAPPAGEPLFYDETAPGAADTMITEDDDEVGNGLASPCLCPRPLWTFIRA